MNHALRVAVAFKREVERGLSGLIHCSDEESALLDAADVTHEVHRGLREEERERECGEKEKEKREREERERRDEGGKKDERDGRGR